MQVLLVISYACNEKPMIKHWPDRLLGSENDVTEHLSQSCKNIIHVLDLPDVAYQNHWQSSGLTFHLDFVQDILHAM